MKGDTMVARSVRRTWGVLLGVPLAWLSCASCALAQQRTFRFGPPEGTTYTVRQSCTTGAHFGWGQRLAGQFALESEVAIERQAAGYRVTQTLRPTTLEPGPSRNEYVTLSRLKLEAQTGIPVVWELDEDLRLLRVSGIDQIGLRFRKAVRRDKTLSDVGRSVARRMLTEEGSLSAAEDHCQRAYASYLGQRAEIGSAWVTTGRFYCMSGEVAEFYTAMKVTGEQRVGDVACVRVEFQSAQDPTELSTFLGPHAVELLDRKTAFTGSARVSESGCRLIDPATMLSYGQEVARTAEFHLPGPGMRDARVVIRESVVYEYDYPD
jgi:hypothetical protein